MSCPSCKKISIVICDNDCHTYFCDNCNSYFYQDISGNWIVGHNPNCGVFSSDDEDIN